MYIGYVGFDSNFTRSKLEYNAGVKEQYQVFATGNVINDNELHRLNCDSARFDEETARQLAKYYGMKLSRNKLWYEVYFPNKNSSRSILRARKGNMWKFIE
jgi:hypothetical protein